MKRNICFILILIVICGVLAGCESDKDLINRITEEIFITSIKDTLIETDKIATTWENDAFLTHVYINFGYSDKETISVYYDSPSHKNVGLGISIIYGELSESKILTEMDITKKINESNWSLDSPEIFSAAVKNKEVLKFIRKNGGDICGVMDLAKWEIIPEHPYIWRVNFFLCKDPIESMTVFIDPLTGSLLDQ